MLYHQGQLAMRAFVVVSQHGHVMFSYGLHPECHHGDAGCTLRGECPVKQAQSGTLCGFNTNLSRISSYSWRYHVKTRCTPM